MCTVMTISNLLVADELDEHQNYKKKKIITFDAFNIPFNAD